MKRLCFAFLFLFLVGCCERREPAKVMIFTTIETVKVGDSYWYDGTQAWYRIVRIADLGIYRGQTTFEAHLEE